MSLPCIPVRVIFSVQPGLSESLECQVPDFSEDPRPCQRTALWFWEKWWDMILTSSDQPWPWPLEHHTVFYRLTDQWGSLELLFPEQAGIVPAIWEASPTGYFERAVEVVG